METNTNLPVALSNSVELSGCAPRSRWIPTITSHIFLRYGLLQVFVGQDALSWQRPWVEDRKRKRHWQSIRKILRGWGLWTSCLIITDEIGYAIHPDLTFTASGAVNDGSFQLGDLAQGFRDIERKLTSFMKTNFLKISTSTLRNLERLLKKQNQTVCGCDERVGCLDVVMQGDMLGDAYDTWSASCDRFG